jgi:hypothetical protein
MNTGAVVGGTMKRKIDFDLGYKGSDNFRLPMVRVEFDEVEGEDIMQQAFDALDAAMKTSGRPDYLIYYWWWVA